MDFFGEPQEERRGEVDAFDTHWDAKALLRDEVRRLAQRVEALIKWTEEFEESVIFVGKSHGGEEIKGDSQGKVPGKFILQDGTAVALNKPNFLPANLQPPPLLHVEEAEEALPEEDDEAEEEKRGDSDDFQQKDDTDLFGASSSFASWTAEEAEEGSGSEETKTPTPTANFSLLAWD